MKPWPQQKCLDTEIPMIIIIDMIFNEFTKSLSPT